MLQVAACAFSFGLVCSRGLIGNAIACLGQEAKESPPFVHTHRRLWFHQDDHRRLLLEDDSLFDFVYRNGLPFYDMQRFCGLLWMESSIYN